MSPNFTPVSSLLGGALIGLAASIILLYNGKIAGISGIFSGILKPVKGDTAWRVAFVAGLLIAGLGFVVLYPNAFSSRAPGSIGLVALAGLLVGFGTRVGSGCTSGHGVCGIARRSPRSITATVTFIATGMVTTYIVRHLLGVAQ
ncbi:MAG: YeeE/YedE family protein [Polyangiaceae bacterium]|nr:YeeE/YedE family protein [Polyangiaceae bacterium]